MVVTNVAVYVGLTLDRCSGQVLYEGFLYWELRTVGKGLVLHLWAFFSCFLLIGVHSCCQFEPTLVCGVCPLDKNKWNRFAVRAPFDISDSFKLSYPADIASFS